MRVLAPLLLAIMTGILPCLAEVRIWTDTEGRTIEAELIAKYEDRIRIRRTDGQVFILPLGRLSETDRQWVGSWTPDPESVASIEDAILLVSTPHARGSAFLVRMEGRVYAVSNQHVLFGAPEGSVELVSVSGWHYRPQLLEVSATRDLARFLVPTRIALEIDEHVALDEPIRAFGNSLGAGVATIEKGRVAGLSADEIEITTGIVEGNSGGPIINAKGAVIGVSTYLKRGNEKWTAEGTRYSKVRRFALRLGQVERWDRVTWSVYEDQTARVNKAESFVDAIAELASELARSPSAILGAETQGFDEIRRIVANHNSNVRQYYGSSRRSDFWSRHRSHLRGLRASLAVHVDNIELQPPRIENGFLLEYARGLQSRADDISTFIEELEERLRI